MKENTLGANISRLRKQAGMTQEELGHAVSVSTQAVSRWERGGSPDISSLTAIADVFGVTLDALFEHEAPSAVSTEDVISQDLRLTPAERRFERAYALAWHMMKAAATTFDPSGGSNYRFMTGIENVDRKAGDKPESVPSVVYISHDTGIMQASVAKDFHYALIMPEPEDGFASIMKYAGEYRRFFACLAEPYMVEMLAFLYTLEPKQHFTAAFAAERLGISPEAAEEVLTEMKSLRMVLDISAETPVGQLHVYHRLEDTAPIPFLYMATELMRAQDIICAVHMRETPFLTEELGARSLSPYWRTHDSANLDYLDAGHRDGCVDQN